MNHKHNFPNTHYSLDLWAWRCSKKNCDVICLNPVTGELSTEEEAWKNAEKYRGLADVMAPREL